MSILGTGLGLVRALPLGLAVPTARGLVLLYLLSSPRVRREIGENHRRLFHVAAPGFWLKQAWRLGENLAWMAHLGQGSMEKLLDKTEVTGENTLERIMLADGRVVVLTLHYGLWELLPALFARHGHRTCVSAGSQRDQGFDALLSSIRQQPGVQVTGSFPDMRQAVRDGTLVGFAVDNATRARRATCGSLWPGFEILAAPFTLARAEGAALVPMFARKDRDCLRVWVEEPVKTPEEFGARARAVITRHPEDWVFWGKGA